MLDTPRAEPQPTTTAAATRAPDSLQSVLNAVAANNNGVMGVYVKNLKTGETATLNANAKLRSASLYKLLVLTSAYERVQSGDLKTDQTIALSQAAFDVDPYNEWTPGTTTTVSCAIQAMVTVSSNSAAEMLLEAVGGDARVTKDMQALGLTQSQIGDDTAYTSPADIAKLLEAIYNRTLVSPQTSDAMLKLLLAQQHNDRLPLPLPLGIQVAHKTGELTDLRNEAGIVYAPSGSYIFVAMVSGATDDSAARSTVVDFASAVYGYFSHGDLPVVDGMPPRLAKDVFQVPDAQGRLAPLWDPFGDAVPLSQTDVGLTLSAKSVRVQPEVVPDLQAMQQAAGMAGVPLWVASGYVAPSGNDWSKVIPTSTINCPVKVAPYTPKVTPTPKPTPSASPTPVPAPASSAAWLGTVVNVSNQSAGPSTDDYASSAAGKWLLAHAWEYGFIPAPAETPGSAARGYEPWMLRWVGQPMAKQLHDQGILPLGGSAPTYPKAVYAQLQKAIQQIDGAGKT